MSGSSSRPRPSEAEWNAYGTLAAQSHFTNAILGAALLAIQMFLVVYGLFAFLKTPKDVRTGRLHFVLLSWAILIASSTDTIIDIWGVFRYVYAGGPGGISYLKALEDNARSSIGTDVLSDAMLVAAIAIGDILMLWRCFVLWRNRAWAVVLPCLTCVGAIVCHILYLVWVVAHTARGSLLVSRAILSAASLSVATNIMVTALILFRLTVTWKRTSKAFPDRKLPRMYSSVAAILIESAAPLAFFGICLVTARTLLVLRAPKNLAEQGRIYVFDIISNGLYCSFCALSPQMIIVRVTTGKSWKDTVESNDGPAPFSKPIQFAPNATKDRASSLTESA